jgi:hypothetical protein
MTFTFPVEFGHIMMFARAVGYDDVLAAPVDTETNIIAPPTFTEGAHHFDPAWEFRPRFDRPPSPSDAEAGPPEGAQAQSGTSFHAETHFEYHGPLRPGDVLTVDSRPGNRWTKRGQRGGTLSFWETIVEYRNEDGELVVTERTVGVSTEQRIDGE